MPWHSEERWRRFKKAWHTTDPLRYRVSGSVAALHYESSIDSGLFDAEVDVSQEVYSGSRVAGFRTRVAGFETGYQDAAPSQAQFDQGTVGFGGRRGEAYANLIPESIGYIDQGTIYVPMLTGPIFGAATATTRPKTIGINDADPCIWTLNTQADIDVGAIWSVPSVGDVNYTVRVSGGQIEPVITIDQALREQLTNDITVPLGRASLGVRYRLHWNDVLDNVDIGRPVNPSGDDFSWSNLRINNSAGRALMYFGTGQVYVPRRGGRLPSVRRIWFDGTDWWLFMGANAQAINQALLPGDLIIDPPITEEDITQNSDDASQSGSAMNLSGTGNELFLGGSTSNYNIGFRFQTVPIARNDTVNTATLEPVLGDNESTRATTTANLYCEVHTGGRGTFTTSANNITGRTRTTAVSALSDGNGDWPALPGTRAAWDAQGPLQELVNGASWNNNEAVVFPVIPSSSTGYLGWEDYNGGAANAADFNADVTAAGPQPPAGSLAFTPNAPLLNLTLGMPAGSAALGGLAPTVDVAGDFTSDPPAGSAVITTNVASLDTAISVPTGPIK